MRRWLPLLGFLALIWLTACDGNEPPPDAPAQESPLAAPPPALPPEPSSFSPPDGWAEEHPILSPNAKLESHFMLLAEMAITPHPGDGKGRAWLEAVTAIVSPSDVQTKPTTWRRGLSDRSRAVVPAGSLQRIEIGFEVGEHGIDEGGLIYVMPEPFWSWSDAQITDPNGLGYTTAGVLGDGVRLVPEPMGAVFRVEGRALEAGERIDIVFGAGPRGTRVDEFAERGSEILIAVDADGDGFRVWLPQSVQIEIAARAGVRIVAFGPAEVAPGEAIEISIAILDANGNRAVWPGAADGPEEADDESDLGEGVFAIESLAGPSLAELGLSEKVTTRAARDEPRRIRFVAPKDETTIRLSIRGRDALEGFAAVINPIVVRASPIRLVWGDLHGHSILSDGTGTPDDYFSYARDVARLDVIALTDHDHWGIRPLDSNPDLVESILRSALRFNQPGRFVTIPGYEWTNWLHGHRHVLYFSDELPIYSAIDPETDSPDELWDALRGQPALTFAHHSAGEPVATNWSYPPDPELEPLTEISSIHGMSEAADAPQPVRGAIEGNFIRDALLRGYRLGFIGSGDSHDGHPGLPPLSTNQSGLAGIFTESLDRRSLLDAMKRKRTFATNGIRPWLQVTLDETFMGGTLPTQTGDLTLRIRYEATTPITRIDLIRSGLVASLEGPLTLSLDLERAIPRLQPGEFHYVRILEEGGGVAWSSPIFVGEPDSGSPGTGP